jgi:hypothetical protein
MAIILPSGFNITNSDPVDARFSLADQAARYALSAANVYEGLIVFQQDSGSVWILTDSSNVGNDFGWTQIQIGTIATAIFSGSSEIVITQLDGFANFQDSLFADIGEKLSIISFNQYTASQSTGSLATTGSNSFIGNQTISGSLNVTGSVNINNVIKLTPVTTFPNGEAGMLVASSSYGKTNLYMYDGSDWKWLVTGSIA